MRLFLTGFMGAGKSRVAAELAGRTGLRHVDLDREVEEEAGLAIPQIFAERGEEGFRELERAALERVAHRDGVVVATGGGTVVDPANVETLRAAGVTVWLRPPVEELLARLSREPSEERPLFESPEQAVRLYEERLAAYATADHELEVAAHESAADVALRVWELVGSAE